MYKNLLISIAIIVITIFTYVASTIDRGVGGFFGFSSLRVTFNQISLYTFCFLASLRLFHAERQKPYRFIYLVPIMSFGYDLFVNVLNARKTSYNEFTPRVTITFIVVVAVVVYYFVKKKTDKNA
jgi:hypothetical protein